MGFDRISENDDSNVMAAVMHLQRAMRRGPVHGHGPHGMGPHHGRPEGMGPQMGKGHCPKGPEMRHGHGMNEGRLIHALSDKESMTTQELMEVLDLRPSSMSELLAKLEERGLIIRSQSEDDRRVNIVSLTDKARNIRERISEERAARMAVFTACFTEDEAKEFCRLCNKLSDHLESLRMVR